MSVLPPMVDSVSAPADPVGSAGAGASLFSFRDLSLVLGGRPILAGIDLEVRKGEILSIVGSSGCGKTTLLRLAAGLIRPSQGQLLLSGQPITHPRQDIAIVFQDYGKALLPWRTAAGNVALALEAARAPAAQRRERIAQLLKLVGLANHGEKFPAQMSGGMQQRLQIARCLAQKPTALLMDEPFGALDAMTRQSLQDEMLDIAGRAGVTVVFVTHDLEEAIYIGDRVVVMHPNPGRIVHTYPIALPRPRDQLTTRELPEFLTLRHELYGFFKDGH